MLYGDRIKEIEYKLAEKGLSPEVRTAIRNEKICIIDDKITDLQGMIDGLKREGFTNLVPLSKSPPVNELLDSHFDLIVLDLNNVALDLARDDGIGILNHIKNKSPFQPVLVVTGQSISADKSTILSRANLIRQKPVRPSDFASDIEQILRTKKDRFWASVAILNELNGVGTELKNELGFWSGIKLAGHRKKLEKMLVRHDPDILDQMQAIFKIVGLVKNTVTYITYIEGFFS